MRILLLTAPMTQLNTSYPATTVLTAVLKERGFDVRQADGSLELGLRLFSKAGLSRVCEKLHSLKRSSPPIRFFIKHQENYLSTVEPVIRFLQGKDPTLAIRIASRQFLPEGARFSRVNDLDLAFGSLGIQDRAKYIASLYLDDVVDVIREGVDPRFELSRYAEKLAASAADFGPLCENLEAPSTLVDEIIEEMTSAWMEQHEPDCVGLSVPFPGNLYGALRIAKEMRRLNPRVRIVLGGGYVNTELRSLREPRLFDFVDAVCLDDGAKPLLCLLEYFQGKRSLEKLVRTWVREKGQVILKNASGEQDIPQRELPTPTYEGLELKSYLTIFEMLNPMHRLWSDGRWNKLTLAHGCYWKKCNFCDLSLDYINRYEPDRADRIVDHIEVMIAETGQSGFHFTDEAAPPALLRAMAARILERGLAISWWTNIRFEKTFSLELTRLLARSGCVAVSGGLEVASNRLLKLMNKGVSVEQVASVAKNFSKAGVLVHAYLMYGFPTQTEKETIQSLERVRRLFVSGCIHSAYWHRFSATAHSPIGREPDRFGIRLHPLGNIQFAHNDLPFEDATGCDHDRLGHGLRLALYNYMHGVGFDKNVREWFGSVKGKGSAR